MAAFEYPADLRYTAEHEWVRVRDASASDEGTVVRVGITAFAQDALGDIVFVQLPAAGEQVEAGTTCGEVESTKSVSDLYAPVTGTVVDSNSALEGSPELVNSDPYEDGWMLDVRIDDASVLDSLMDAEAYRETTA